jgi:DNA-binding beta-propeller fold protein YncE
MARTWMVLALVLGCVVALSGGSDAAVLYAADGSSGHLSSLVILNPATGAVSSVVGPIGFAVTGLAVHPLTGLLYESTSRLDPSAASSLLLIDKTTGLGTMIGAYGVPGGSTMPDITFTPDGQLYGWGPADQRAAHD